MPANRKGAASNQTRQALNEIEQRIKDAQKKSRALLKKAGTDVRAVRHDVAALKKVGLVSKRVDVRKYLPTRYMLKKIERNRDVLSGESIAVRASKSIRDKYVSKGIYEQRGSVLVVPREYANQRTRISRGLVEISRPLRIGEEIRLVLPFKATDMEGVAHKLKDDPTLDGMKRGDELFGFRLYGHNMNTIGFPSADELADYILTHYSHLFSGKSGREGVKHFELFRFKSGNSQLSMRPESERIYTPRKHQEHRRGDRDHVVKQRRKRDAARKAKIRENETAEQRSKRLASQKLRSARNRQREFEGD